MCKHRFNGRVFKCSGCGEEITTENVESVLDLINSDFAGMVRYLANLDSSKKILDFLSDPNKFNTRVAMIYPNDKK